VDGVVVAHLDFRLLAGVLVKAVAAVCRIVSTRALEGATMAYVLPPMEACRGVVTPPHRLGSRSGSCEGQSARS